VRVSFHLGPEVRCNLDGNTAEMSWTTASHRFEASLALPPLRWEVVRGGSGRGEAWYSPSYGVKVPSTSLIGTGEVNLGDTLETTLEVVAVREDVLVS
jgi:hypothetical protein